MQFVVLFGPQAGAHVTLYSGSYVVGSGEDEDVVVMGRGVAEAHFRFELDAETGQLTVGACSSDVFAEGARSLAPGDQINLPQKFWLSDVVIGIGDLETRWDEPQFAQSPHAANAKMSQTVSSSAEGDQVISSAPKNADNKDSVTGSSRHVVAHDGDDAANADSFASVVGEHPRAEASSPTRTWKPGFVIPISIVAVAVIIGLLTVLFVDDEQTSVMPGPSAGVVEAEKQFGEIEGLLTGIADVSDVKASLVNGEVNVTGYAPTPQTIKMISDAVLSVAPDAQINVIADSDLEQKAASILARRDAKVNKVEDGVVYVEGVVSDPGAREQLVAFAQEELTDAAAIDAEKVYEIRELIDVFGDQLKQQGLSRISLRSLRDEIIVSGRLRWAQLGAWESLLSKWTAEYGLKFRDASPLVLDGDDMPFELVAAVGGENGFLFLSGQNKVHVGGEVAPGYILKSVADGALVITHAARDYMIDIREAE